MLLFCALFGLACAGTNEAGKKYLAEKSKEKDVTVLASGLQYKVLRKGDGAHHPTADSSCECHYSGKLIDGTTFDSSYDRGSPTSFAPNQVIKGWTEAMQLMVEGDKWEMYIPSELGYGDSGSPPKIQGGDVLVFVMEIIKIKGNKVDAITCDPKTLDGCNTKEKKYVEKLEKKFAGDTTKLEAELKRLDGMKGSKLKAELQTWISRRSNILKKLTAKEEL